MAETLPVVRDTQMWMPVVGDTREIRELLRENLGLEKITIQQLERVTVPGAGGLSFTRTILGVDQEVKEIQGVLLASKNVRVYYSKGYGEDGGGVPPDCVSLDMCVGYGTPGGECNDCPYSKFGSDNGGEGRGKACKERRYMFILPPGESFPLYIDAPPGSLKSTEKYLMDLVRARIRMTQVITSFTLVREKNKDDIKYSLVKCQVVAKLDPENATKYAVLSAYYRKMLDEQTPEDATPQDE